MMRVDSRTRAKLCLIAVLLSPALVVQATRLLSNSTIATASALPASTPPPAATRGAHPLTQQQVAAADWLLTHFGKELMQTPMERPEPNLHPTTAVNTQTTLTPPSPENIDLEPKHLKLTAMVGEGSSALAVLNHRLRRIGDDVAPGWKLTKVNSRLRSITITAEDGRTIELAQPMSNE